MLDVTFWKFQEIKKIGEEVLSSICIGSPEEIRIRKNKDPPLKLNFTCKLGRKSHTPHDYIPKFLKICEKIGFI